MRRCDQNIGGTFKASRIERCLNWLTANGQPAAYLVGPAGFEPRFAK